MTLCSDSTVPQPNAATEMQIYSTVFPWFCFWHLVLLLDCLGLIVSGNLIECPKHNGCFDFKTGEAKRLPARAPLATYITLSACILIHDCFLFATRFPTRVKDGRVLVVTGELLNSLFIQCILWFSFVVNRKASARSSERGHGHEATVGAQRGREATVGAKPGRRQHVKLQYEPSWARQNSVRLGL